MIKIRYIKGRRLVEDISKLGLLLSIVFVAVSLVYLVSKVLHDLTALSEFSSAFAGALFGYLAVRLTDIVKDMRERQIINIKALVSLEHLNMQAIDKVGTAEFVAKDWKNSFERAKTEKKVVLNFNQFREVPIDRKPLLDLLNLDLINDFAKYFSIVERVNDSMYSLEKFYDSILKAAINGDTASYISNLDTLIEKTAEVLLFIEELVGASEVIQAKTRIIFDDTSKSLLLNAVRLGKSQNHYTPGQIKRFDTEVKRLRKELETSAAKDKARINKIISGK